MHCQTDGRSKGTNLKRSPSAGSTEGRVIHNTVLGKSKLYCLRKFFDQFIPCRLDPEQLDRLKAHSPVDELDLFRVSSSPLMSPFLASDAALRKLPAISLLVNFLKLIHFNN